MRTFLLVMSFILLSAFATGCQTRQQVEPPPPVPTPPPVHQPTTTDRTTPNLAGGDEIENRRTHPPTYHAKPATGQQILFYSGPSTEKVAALTFDDGPDTVFTSQILDLLHREGVKATFFVIGTRAAAHPEIIKRIVDEGHAIGNHSWDHPQLTKMTPAEIHNELQQTEGVLTPLIGYRTSLFRPPYGESTSEIVQTAAADGYQVIDWSVDTRDWAGTSPSLILSLVRKEIRPGGIILEHSAGGKNESLANTVEALPTIISTLRSQGYSFATIPELLHISGAKD